MPANTNDVCEGPIPGLHLPQQAWFVLERENIRTMDRLKAVAGRIEHLLPGIGPKTADAIRAELARVGASRSLSEESPLLAVPAQPSTQG